MPPAFRMEDHGPRKLRVAIVHGLIFGTFAAAAPPNRGLPWRRHLRPHWTGSRRPHAGRAGTLHAGAAEQLEALYGEREGLLSRQHPASLLHNVRDQPPAACRPACPSEGRRGLFPAVRPYFTDDFIDRSRRLTVKRFGARRCAARPPSRPLGTACSLSGRFPTGPASLPRHRRPS
jgi:hypothetical protein